MNTDDANNPAVLTFAVTDTIQIHESVRLRRKDGTSGKALSETFSGEDLQHSTGRWMKKERNIDWQNDRYFEIVTDPQSGAVIHYCDEPLSEHRSRGSAKNVP